MGRFDGVTTTPRARQRGTRVARPRRHAHLTTLCRIPLGHRRGHIGCTQRTVGGGGPTAESTPDASSSEVEEAEASSDGGKPPQSGSDGGKSSAGTIELVAPQLSHDLNTGVYTASFRIKNGTTHDILELSSLEISGAYAFPKIDRAVCPPGTPGYQGGVPAAEISAPLGVAFASSPANLKTVIDLTCGSKKPCVPGCGSARAKTADGGGAAGSAGSKRSETAASSIRS